VTISEYLNELERYLPRIRRRRALAEVEAHLLDSAARYARAGASVTEAEKSATRDFGDARIVARGFAAEAAVTETRLATALALGAVALFVFPLYVVPENTLPPASWAEKPADIFVLQLVTVALWVTAGALAALSVVLAWTRLSRFAARVLDLVPLALAGSIVVSAALVVRWFAATAVTGSWPLIAAPLAAVCLAASAGSACWAHRRRVRLVRN
jgi:hypothetical protein